MSVRQPLDPQLPIALRQRPLRRDAEPTRGTHTAASACDNRRPRRLPLLQVRATWHPTWLGRHTPRFAGAAYLLPILSRGLDLIVKGEIMTITLIGLFMSLSVALTDPRPTVSLGCWFLTAMFTWLTIEELWFLYKSRNPDEE